MKMIAQKALRPSLLRMALYAEGTRTTKKVRVVVVWQGFFLVVTRREIAPSTWTEFPINLTSGALIG